MLKTTILIIVLGLVALVSTATTSAATLGTSLNSSFDCVSDEVTKEGKKGKGKKCPEPKQSNQTSKKKPKEILVVGSKVKAEQGTPAAQNKNLNSKGKPKAHVTPRDVLLVINNNKADKSPKNKTKIKKQKKDGN